MPAQDALAPLRTLPGIGPFSAESILIRSAPDTPTSSHSTNPDCTPRRHAPTARAIRVLPTKAPSHPRQRPLGALPRLGHPLLRTHSGTQSPAIRSRPTYRLPSTTRTSPRPEQSRRSGQSPPGTSVACSRQGERGAEPAVSKNPRQSGATHARASPGPTDETCSTGNGRTDLLTAHRLGRQDPWPEIIHGLLRPDGHPCQVAGGADPEGLRAYLARWLPSEFG